MMSKAHINLILKQYTGKKYLWVAMSIVLCSLLPFLCDLLTDHTTGKPKNWLPNLGIVDFLTLEDGTIWGYSDYGIFLFITGLYVSVFLGWVMIFYLTKYKPYRFVFLYPVLLTGCQLFIIIFNLKTTELNTLTIKITLLLLLVLLFRFSKNKKFFWTELAAIACSLLPFIHDIIANKEGVVRSWIPNLGVEIFLTDTEGYVLGYGSYDVFLFILGLYVSMFLAWFVALYFARFKPYRFAFFFPVVLFGYELFLNIFNLGETKLNRLNYKIIVFIILGILLVLNFFLNKKNQKKLHRDLFK